MNKGSLQPLKIKSVLICQRLDTYKEVTFLNGDGYGVIMIAMGKCLPKLKAGDGSFRNGMLEVVQW